MWWNHHSQDESRDGGRGQTNLIYITSPPYLPFPLQDSQLRDWTGISYHKNTERLLTNNRKKRTKRRDNQELAFLCLLPKCRLWLPTRKFSEGFLPGGINSTGFKKKVPVLLILIVIIGHLDLFYFPSSSFTFLGLLYMCTITLQFPFLKSLCLSNGKSHHYFHYYLIFCLPF